MACQEEGSTHGHGLTARTSSQRSQIQSCHAALVACVREAVPVPRDVEEWATHGYAH